MTETNQDSLDPSETVVAEFADGTRLVRRKTGGAVYRGGNSQVVREFDRYDDARLYAGLWQTTGGWLDVEHAHAIPLSVAVAGKPAIAAYLRVGGSRNPGRDAETVAEWLDVTPEAISNYCYKVRYNGD